MEVGEMIRTARKREGFSQGQLGEMLGWQDHSRVSRLENGTSPLPTIGPHEFEVLTSRLKIDGVELLEAMGYRLHLAPTERIYPPLLKYLARFDRDRQRALLDVLQGPPTAEARE